MTRHLIQGSYAPLVEAPVRPFYSIFPLPSKSAFGKLGASTTTRRFQAKASAAAILCKRQVVLGDLATVLAGLEEGLDSAPTGDCRSLAPSGIQAVLDMAFAASYSCGKKMRQQAIA
jgi:hypothetical protein